MLKSTYDDVLRSRIPSAVRERLDEDTVIAEDARTSADLSAWMPDRGFGVKNEGSLPMEQETPVYSVGSLRLEDSCRDLLILSPHHHHIGGAVSSTLSPKAPFLKSLHHATGGKGINPSFPPS